MNEPHITLTVAIDRDGDHISGRVSAAGGHARPFEGRIGLMAAIDAFVADEPPRAPTPPSTQESTA
ncbi:MAG: hypothetical protein U0237_19535 [Thermoleophilia bacterium]